MIPLLVSALVGIGVKIATDLLMSGAKEVMKPSGSASSSFATTLDKARTTAEPGAATVGTKLVGLDAGLAERSQLIAVELNGSLPTTGRALGAEAYRRFSESQAP